jgi:hypothetical protein
MATKKSLADLMGAFAQKTNSDSNNSNATWKLFFPFWKADIGTTSRLRFLPDLDESNPMGFLVENLTHELIVNGKKKVVACGKMYNERCPICELSQKYYDEKSPDYNKDLGWKFYRKKNYIGQILVVDTPVEHDHNQLVKLIEFGPKIFKQIQAAFQSGDLENPPYEFMGGHDFRINKTKSGDYADYGTSSFAPRASDVAADVIEQIELFELSKYRAPFVAPDVLEAMLVAAQTGGEYNDGSSPAPAPAKTPAPAPAQTPAASTADAADEAPASAAPAKMSIADQIRQRQAAKLAAQAGDDE